VLLTKKHSCYCYWRQLMTTAGAEFLYNLDTNKQRESVKLVKRQCNKTYQIFNQLSVDNATETS